MSTRSGFHPGLTVDAAARDTTSHGGAVVLLETVRAVGLDRAFVVGAGAVA